MNKPQKKDLEGMAIIHGKANPECFIGYGYNQAWNDWQAYEDSKDRRKDHETRKSVTETENALLGKVRENGKIRYSIH